MMIAIVVVVVVDCFFVRVVTDLNLNHLGLSPLIKNRFFLPNFSVVWSSGRNSHPQRNAMTPTRSR